MNKCINLTWRNFSPTDPSASTESGTSLDRIRYDFLFASYETNGWMRRSNGDNVGYDYRNFDPLFAKSHSLSACSLQNNAVATITSAGMSDCWQPGDVLTEVCAASYHNPQTVRDFCVISCLTLPRHFAERVAILCKEIGTAIFMSLLNFA
jgi:hypothetical protein